jgi:acetyl-CoA carboxylase biotin carboxyl carrier protein
MTDDLDRPIDAVAAGDAGVAGSGQADVIGAGEASAPVGDIAQAAAVAQAAAPAPSDPGHASLLALVDRLGGLLERSDLTEIEVEVGGTAVVLRKPSPVAPLLAAPATAAPPVAAGPDASQAATPAAAPARPSIKAPLTGIWYASPAPGSSPFVEAGREIAVGQVVGLIEAMKLFNEIKSDLAGRVVRVVPDSGALVKAKQPLIEVEPL